MAKHRETIFCVVRTECDEGLLGEYNNPVICAATISLNRAEELKGSYEQNMKDIQAFDYFQFEIQTTTFYDE